MPRWSALSAASALPATALVVYVAGLEPSIPLLDHWELFEFYHAAATDSLTLRDWWVPHHAVHVIAFPRLVLMPLALATGWDLRAELALSLVLVLGSLAALVLTDRREGGPARGVADLLCALLLCAPGLYWAWTWSCGFFHFLVNACAIGAAVSLAGPAGPGLGRVATAAACAAIASVSRVEGVLLWLALAPAVAARLRGSSAERRGLALWGAGALACIAVVGGCIVWLRAPEFPSVAPAPLLSRPLTSLGVALGLVGRPVAVGLDGWLPGAPDPRVYALPGALLLAALLVFCARGLRLAWRGDTDRLPALLAWAGLAAFGMGFAVAAGLGRVAVLESDLLGSFWPTMYSVGSALVAVATLRLGALFAATRHAAAAAAVLAALLAASAWQLWPVALEARAVLDDSPVCWELQAHLAEHNSCFVRNPSPERVHRISEAGFREVRRDLVLDAAPRRERGVVEAARRSEGAGLPVEVRGTVPAPAPAAVLLELDGAGRFVSRARFEPAADGRVVWRAPAPLRGAARVRAWRYDREAGRIERLAGEVPLPAP